MLSFITSSFRLNGSYINNYVYLGWEENVKSNSKVRTVAKTHTFLSVYVIHREYLSHFVAIALGALCVAHINFPFCSHFLCLSLSLVDLVIENYDLQEISYIQRYIYCNFICNLMRTCDDNKWGNKNSLYKLDFQFYWMGRRKWGRRRRRNKWI